MYVFDNISHISHQLEYIYELIHDERVNSTEQIFNIFLKTSDHVRNLLNDDDFSKSQNISNHQLLEK